MNITNIRIRKMLDDGRLRAVVSVTVDDMLAVNDVKVVQGDDRLFVAMPSRRDEIGIFRDIVHPISAEAREYFEQSVISAYEERLRSLDSAQENGSL